MVSFTLEYSNNLLDSQSKKSVGFDSTSSYWATHRYSGSLISSQVCVFDISTNTRLDSAGYVNANTVSNGIRFSPSDSYIGAARGQTVNIFAWDSTNETLSSEAELTQAGNTVNDVAWSPDGAYLAYSSADGNTYIHDNDPANGFPFVTSVSSVADPHNACEFSPDSVWLATGEGSTYQVYDTSWTVVASSQASQYPVQAVGWDYDATNFYTDKERYSSDFDRTRSTAEEWETADFSSSTDGVVYSEVSGDNSAPDILGIHGFPTTDNPWIAVCGENNDVVVHDVSADSTVTTLIDPTNNTNDVRWSPDGSWLATASDDNYVYVYSVTLATFSGTVTDNADGTAVEGAVVWAINANDGSITGRTTTAADGTYSIDAPDTTTEHHLICQWTDGSGNEHYSLSKPYVTGAK